MEYHRKEDNNENKDRMFLLVSSTVDDEENENSSNDEECKCRVTTCWIPELKTIGKFICGDGWMAKDDLAEM